MDAEVGRRRVITKLFLIVLLGDSISKDPAWPVRVERSGVVRIRNLSEGGASARSWAEVDDYGHFSPWGTTWGMIALGTNDGYRRSQRTLFDFYFDLLTISNRMLEAGAPRVILLLMPTETARPASHAKRRQFNALQAVMCQYIAEFVCIDISDMPMKFFNNQNPHPTFLGQRWIAGRVKQSIEAL